jgi:thioesterase domain-containing protein
LVNYSAYVLDEKRKLVPIGVPGELYIGGDGLAAGYLNRPELTAERFVENPFGDGRLYRTGDHVRWLDEGSLDFLGRFDEQVKVRGFRVELGEIEAALARHPAVSLAALTVREEPGGEKQLIAWASPASGATLQPDELLRFLKQTLPPYMIPARMMVLDALPLTTSGKIDRQALPEPPVELAEDHRDEIASPLTAQLIQVWEELLGVQPIGIHQDFFALGGHSLLTVRMVNRLAALFGRAVPVTTLFAAPTISQLAAYLVAQERADVTPPIQVQPGSRHPDTARDVGPLFFFDGDWLGGGLYCRNLARLIDQERPFYTVPPHGVDGGEVPESIPAMAADRLEALLKVQPEGPFVLCGYCAGGLVALETARQLEAKGRRVDLVILLDSVADEAGGIPWRRLRNRVRPWTESDWRGRAAWIGGGLKRRLVPEKRDRDSTAEDYGTFDWARTAPASYIRSLASYRLTPYAGRVSLIFTKDSEWALDPEVPWRNTASNLEIRWVAGDHTTALAAYAAETAGAIREALSRVEAPVRAEAPIK